MNKNNVLEIINDNLISTNYIHTPGLLDGSMGVCLYWFILHRYTKEQKYLDKAEQLIDNVCQLCPSLLSSEKLSFEKGLSGISWGITFLAEHGYIDPDVENALGEIEDYIFRRLASKSSDALMKIAPFLYGIIIYYIYNIKFSEEKATKFVNLKKSLLIVLINTIDNQNTNDGFVQLTEEPFLFNINEYRLPLYLYIIAETYRLGFYNYKLDRMIDGLSIVINRSFPALNSHRIILLASIYHLMKVKPIPAWYKHAKIMEQSIDTDEMLRKEFKDKSINFKNGLSGLLFVLRIIPETDQFVFKEDLCKQIVQKISKSSVIQSEEFDKLPIGLMMGKCGIAFSLLLDTINKQST